MRRSWSTLLFVLLLAFASGTPGAADDLCDISDVVILGTNSVQLAMSSRVASGDVVANDASDGPVLDEGAELAVDRGASIAQNAKGDTVNLDRLSSIGGVLSYNELVDDGAAAIGGTSSPLPLPVFEDLPPFEEAQLRSTCADVVVPAWTTVVLGDESPRETCYGTITIDKGGTVVFFGGGAFDVRSIGVASTVGGACPFPCRSILFDSATSLRVEGRLQTAHGTFIGPDPLSDVGASDIVVFVAGENGGDGELPGLPPAVNIGRASTVEVNFYVPNGTFELDRGSSATGAFFARDVNIKRDSTVDLASAFVNRPPTANPQTVFTQGAASVVITLNGNDPESQNLSFEIVHFPDSAIGSLGSITPIDPPPVGRCSVSNQQCDPAAPLCPDPNDVCEEVADPPVSSATVVYTPVDPGADLENDFTFRVTDPCGASGTALVEINPPGDGGTQPCPLIPVDARDVSIGTTPGAPVAVDLDAVGPECGAELVYRITSLPTGASLSDSSGSAIESVPYELPADSVVFVAAKDGSYSFGYQAEDATGPNTGSDSATVFVDVGERPELAVNQSVTTAIDTPVVVTLRANPGGTGNPVLEESSPAFSVGAAFTGSQGTETEGAAIAGNVSDRNGDGLGDGRDNLPGAAPVLISAGVDVNLGAGSSGSVSDPAGDATDLESDDPANPDLVSASISSDGTDLNLSVRFVAAGFSTATTRGSFVLDIDENPATGFPGIDAANNDAALMGVEFLVDIGADLGATAEVLKFVSLPNSFSAVGTFPVTVLGDGYDVTIPLSTFDNDDGRMTFKAETQSFLGSGYTGILDYAPDLGLAPGRSGTGVQGVARLQIEWDITGLQNTELEEIESATVILTTEKGTVDELDTFFYVGAADGNGVLDVSDFQAPATRIPAVMPVPADAQEGEEGTFSINVTRYLKAALTAGFDYLVLQGRVDESLAEQGFKRGLQIRSTAAGNLSQGKEPQLSVTIVEPPIPLTYTVLSLPANGRLADLAGVQVFAGQSFNQVTSLVFTPSLGFSGATSFDYQVQEGAVVDTAVIAILVTTGDCLINEAFCDDGRNVASQLLESSAGSEDEAQLRLGPGLSVEVTGPGSVSSSRRYVGESSYPGLVCGGTCRTSFAEGSTVVLYARPEEAGTEFVGWGGDCSGSHPVTIVTVRGETSCTAVFQNGRGSVR